MRGLAIFRGLAISLALAGLCSIIRLNKCFYAETYLSATLAGINTWVYLSDLQENRIYGGFHKSSNIGLFYCNLQDQECHSEANWNELVNPYMED